MGGKAFSSGPFPLSTPRMPPGIYYTLRDHYLHLLTSFFKRVATPIEAPSKSSYGDIDILVSEPTPPLSNPPSQSLAQALPAERVFTTPKSATTSYAVPYPDHQNDYVQLDIHICPPSTFNWQFFHQSHGDLWNLLGTTIRPFGLTANDQGLHVRIAEIEKLDRKKSMINLTSDPDDVLTLLGLDVERYASPFESVEAMYEYVVGCSFFRSEPYIRGDLKANDRKRLAQRDLFRRFLDEWLPDNESWIRPRIERKPSISREGMIEMVLERFSKTREYEQRVEEWRRERTDLLSKQEERQQRKADAEELEEYANAWIMWLKGNG